MICASACTAVNLTFTMSHITYSWNNNAAFLVSCKAFLSCHTTPCSFSFPDDRGQLDRVQQNVGRSATLREPEALTLSWGYQPLEQGGRTATKGPPWARDTKSTGPTVSWTHGAHPSKWVQPRSELKSDSQRRSSSSMSHLPGPAIAKREDGEPEDPEPRSLASGELEA